MKKRIQINTQMDFDIYAIFLDIASEQNIKPSTLLGKIATDYVQFHYYKIQRGDITFSQSILKKLFESIDPGKIDGIAKYNAEFIISEIKVQEGSVTYKILVDHFSKWNKVNHILFKRIPQEGSDMFVSKHNICRIWSEIQCKTYAKAFELVGETILEKDYDSDDSYSIEVARN